MSGIREVSGRKTAMAGVKKGDKNWGITKVISKTGKTIL